MKSIRLMSQHNQLVSTVDVCAKNIAERAVDVNNYEILGPTMIVNVRRYKGGSMTGNMENGQAVSRPSIHQMWHYA